MVRRRPSTDCVFPLGNTHTSSGAIRATTVRDSEEDGHARRGCREQPSGCVTWRRGNERSCLHGDKEGVLQLVLDSAATECRPLGQDWQSSTTSVTDTEKSEQRSRGDGFLRSARSCFAHSLAVLKEQKSRLFDVSRHSPMVPWTIRRVAWVVKRYNVRRDA